jgi:hypothetical protein
MVVLVSMPHENPYKNGLDSIDIPCYRKTLEKRFPISLISLTYFKQAYVSTCLYGWLSL